MHSYSKYFPVRNTNDSLDIASVLHTGLTANPYRELLTFSGESWSVGRMAAHVGNLQVALANLGLKTGDRAALMLENSPLHIALIYAMALSGITWVPVNHKLKAMGIEYLLDHCEPSIIIADPVFLTELSGILPSTAKTRILSSADIAPDLSHKVQPTCSNVRYDLPLCIIYTSGTTGSPKGVIFTHRMMRIASESARIVADIRDGDRLFLWEPLCHIGGAQMLMTPFLTESCLVVAPTFSARAFWDQIEQGKCTQLHYLGGILDILTRMPRTPRDKTSTLRLAWGAGLDRSAWVAAKDHFQIELRECYGMTEGASFATVNNSNKPGSIGQALPWLTVQLLDDNDQPVAAGMAGQVVVSSHIAGNFLPAYLNNPTATAKVLRDNKLYTGDIARADEDGDLYFVGRLTDSMRVRGENVSAWEIERVFLSHPNVAAAAAIGVNSEIGEQEILLYVQWQLHAELSFQNLCDWASQHLARYQLPRYFRHVSQFDLTPSERIQKHLLSRDPSLAWDRESVARGVAETHPFYSSKSI